MDNFEFVSLFSGIGGFDKGFEKAGMKTVLQVEQDKYANQILKKHWPDTNRMKDVRDVGKLGDSISLICGGFPCQDLSVAGNRAGLAGDRSGLWWEFARIIEVNRPRWVVIENVPGLLSSGKDDSGRKRDMGILLGKLAKLGYWWAYRVLDSQYFGVAQRRRRVFIVAHLTEPTYPAKVLFEPESGERHTAPSREKRKGDSPDLEKSTLDFGRVADRIRVNPDVSVTLQGEGGGQGAKTGLYLMPEVTGTLPTDTGSATSGNELDLVVPEISNTLQTKRRDGIGPDHETFIPEIARTLTSREGMRHDDTLETYVIKMAQTGSNGHPVSTKDISGTLSGISEQVVFQQNQRDELRLINEDGQITGALPSQPGMKQQNYVAEDTAWTMRGGKPGEGKGYLGSKQQAMTLSGQPQYVGVRRLTPLECERLQSFPDGFTEIGSNDIPISDTQRYKMLGNAVTVNVIEWIGKRIMELDSLDN